MNGAPTVNKYNDLGLRVFLDIQQRPTNGDHAINERERERVERAVEKHTLQQNAK